MKIIGLCVAAILLCSEWELRAQGSTTLRVAVELGDDDAANLNRLLKSRSLCVASLANGAIHDEDNIVGVLSN